MHLSAWTVPNYTFPIYTIRDGSVSFTTRHPKPFVLVYNTPPLAIDVENEAFDARINEIGKCPDYCFNLSGYDARDQREAHLKGRSNEDDFPYPAPLDSYFLNQSGQESDKPVDVLIQLIPKSNVVTNDPRKVTPIVFRLNHSMLTDEVDLLKTLDEVVSMAYEKGKTPKNVEEFVEFIIESKAVDASGAPYRLPWMKDDVFEGKVKVSIKDFDIRYEVLVDDLKKEFEAIRIIEEPFIKDKEIEILPSYTNKHLEIIAKAIEERIPFHYTDLGIRMKFEDLCKLNLTYTLNDLYG